MVINWLDFIWYELTLKGISEQVLSRGHLLVELSLARLFSSRWHDSATVTATIVHQSLVQLCNSGWHDSSTVTGIILQQSLARLFSSGWHDSSRVTGIILQQFNSHWYDCSTVVGTILKQSRARFFLFSILPEFCNSEDHCWRIVPCTRNVTPDPESLNNVAWFWCSQKTRCF